MSTTAGTPTFLDQLPDEPSVDRFQIGSRHWPSICLDPYQALLPAFFLPNIRAIECSNIRGDMDSMPLGPDAPDPHTSPITTIDMNSSDMRLATFEKLLRLPKALVVYRHRNAQFINNGCTLSEIVKLLSKYQASSLEILTLDGLESTEVFAEPRSATELFYTPKGIGSLRHFEKLRVIEAPYWSLVTCPNWEKLPDADKPSFLDILPRSLEVLKLTLDEFPMRLMGYLYNQLETLIRKKKEMYPRLTRVEVIKRYDVKTERPEWNFGYTSKDFIEWVGILAMSEKVDLVIH